MYVSLPLQAKPSFPSNFFDSRCVQSLSFIIAIAFSDRGGQVHVRNTWYQYSDISTLFVNLGIIGRKKEIKMPAVCGIIITFVPALTIKGTKN